MTTTEPRISQIIRAPLTGKQEWFQRAVIYEVHIRAFADSNGDGVGDLPGLTSKLDYLADLGVTALWLLPFYPSPLRDGGYDIADYHHINPAYGTMGDFEVFVREAHARGLKVITELVLNHTSSDHAWFQRARRAPPGSPERDFYVWSESPHRYPQARIIFKDFETSNWAWDPVAKAYYWHRFYSHQPDLNFDNPAVHDALFEVVDFWFGLGVDGLRLDAVPYLYEREGTDCENLPETHAFLKRLRAHVDQRFAGRMLLAEANQWPNDAASYFGAGDECHMNFHFPLMPRMFMALHMEDRFPIVDILRQTPALPEGCQWATFLRNHDELTLEMVTDEERDYMYRVYTEDPVARINLGIRRRLAPLLGSRRKIELLTSLLFSLPGTPVLYYGDEIGMGDNVYLGDRDGVRTPMQWSGDRNAGFSRANPQKLYLPVIVDPEYHYEAVNVEAQQGNPSSLLWWTKRMIALSRETEAFGRGGLEFLRPDNPRVLAFLRSAGDQRVLVVANLSRHPQFAELDLAAHAGTTPVEMFGRTRFPPIGEQPYRLTFGPHTFLWFLLEPAAAQATSERPRLTAAGGWVAALREPAFAAALLAFVVERRWFRGKARARRGARVLDLVELPVAERTVAVVLEVAFIDGEPERYLVPVGFATADRAAQLDHGAAAAVIATVALTPDGAAPDGDGGPTAGVLYDALATGEGAAGFLAIARGAAEVAGRHGAFRGASGAALAALEIGAPRPTGFEQSNTTVPFGDAVMLKVFRQLEPGINAELEIGEFLSARADRARCPAVLGSVSYHDGRAPAAAVAVVTELIANEGTAWELFTRELEALFDKVLAPDRPPPAAPAGHVFDRVDLEPPTSLVEQAGPHLRWSRVLGRRTGELHRALAGGTDAAFVPEPFTVMHQQSLFQGGRALMVRTFEALGRRLPTLPEEVQAEARAVLAVEAEVIERMRRVQARPIDAWRIRSHGDLHLGQVLFTGDDFVVIDFEGEPARPLGERRYKRNALRDVAGMLRSLAYAAESSLRTGPQRARDVERLRPWAEAWAGWMGAAFVAGYLDGVGDAGFVPQDAGVRRTLLDFYAIEKCVYEIGYELNNRPDWLGIPVHGLLTLIEGGAAR